MRADTDLAQLPTSARVDAQPRPQGLLAVLARRWVVVVVTLVLSLAVAAVYILTARKQYTSAANLYIQPSAGSASPNFLNTQREVIASKVIAAMVINDPEISSLNTFESTDNPVTWLLHELRVEVSKSTDIIHVELETPYRDEAPVIVNAVVNAYIRFQTGQSHAINS